MPEVKQQVKPKEPSKQKKGFSLWLNASNGKPSTTTTFATVAFAATTFAYLASIFESIGSISFRAFDAAACSTYLIPILSLYFGRRWTEASILKKTEEQQ